MVYGWQGNSLDTAQAGGMSLRITTRRQRESEYSGAPLPGWTAEILFTGTV
jgi:hypothetical protein